MSRTSPTLAHGVFGWLRRWLPSPLARVIRAVGTGVLTPIYFSLDTGHFRSSLAGRALDKFGNPIPWYTYPLIELLQTQDFHERTILEFGAGQSTLWWGQRAKLVVSFETDAAWFRYVKERATPNVSLFLVKDVSQAESVVKEGQWVPFDVIVIDGLDRVKAACLAAGVLSPKGAIILDNAEQPWGGQDYPIIAFLRGCGFSRVDFYGFAPGVSLAHCTSVLFRGECFLFEGQKPPMTKRWVMPCPG